MFPGTPDELKDWVPTDQEAEQLGLTVAQRRVLVRVSRLYVSHSHAIVRGMRIRAEAYDSKCIYQDSGIAATFSVPPAQPGPDATPTYKTWFGVVVAIMRVQLGSTQLFFRVRWFRYDLVFNDPDCPGMEVIKGTGTDSDFDTDTDSLIRPERIDQQVFFVDVPHHVMFPVP